MMRQIRVPHPPLNTAPPPTSSVAANQLKPEIHSRKPPMLRRVPPSSQDSVKPQLLADDTGQPIKDPGQGTLRSSIPGKPGLQTFQPFPGRHSPHRISSTPRPVRGAYSLVAQGSARSSLNQYILNPGLGHRTELARQSASRQARTRRHPPPPSHPTFSLITLSLLARPRWPLIGPPDRGQPFRSQGAAVVAPPSSPTVILVIRPDRASHSLCNRPHSALSLAD